MVVRGSWFRIAMRKPTVRAQSFRDPFPGRIHSFQGFSEPRTPDHEPRTRGNEPTRHRLLRRSDPGPPRPGHATTDQTGVVRLCRPDADRASRRDDHRASDVRSLSHRDSHCLPRQPISMRRESSLPSTCFSVMVSPSPMSSPTTSPHSTSATPPASTSSAIPKSASSPVRSRRYKSA